METLWTFLGGLFLSTNHHVGSQKKKQHVWPIHAGSGLQSSGFTKTFGISRANPSPAFALVSDQCTQEVRQSCKNKTQLGGSHRETPRV